jgi:undecaprenyl-diphosphatase
MTHVFELLDCRELAIVERTAAFSQRWRLTPFARVVSRLGNGWLYPIAALFLTGSIRCLGAAAASIATAFAIYPLLKRSLARTRPCDSSDALFDPMRPLDRYSFPSGHAMTAAAFGVPILFAAPASVSPIVIGGCVLVSWSRVALGHHYLTDIFAGTLVGAAIAAIVATIVL